MAKREQHVDEQLRRLVEDATPPMSAQQQEGAWERIVDRHAFDGIAAPTQPLGRDVRRKRRVRRVAVLAALLLAAFAAGMAVADRPLAPTQVVPERSDAGADRSVSQADRERLAMITRQVYGAQALPASEVQLLGEDERIGRVLFLAARPAGEGCFLIMKGANSLDHSCNTELSSVSGIMVSELHGSAPGGRRIFDVSGIAADDVDRILLRFADGSVERAHRVANAYRVEGTYEPGNPPVELVVSRRGREVLEPLAASRIAGSNR